jgi:geranylgeranyl pyrophosphate synthase
MSVVADELFAPIAGELREFEERIHSSIAADLGPMAEAMEHVVKAGGKRLRPALVILSARLGTADRDEIFSVAMGIEFIHTATLVHDDLIDSSPTRRGIRTIHEALGPNPAIIIGDYYFAKGANLLSAVGEPRIDNAISQAVMTICMGELMQMVSRRDYDQSLDDYHSKIERKTATLLSTCCYAGALVGRLDERTVETLRNYGYLLGMAFQVEDDILDYKATSAQVGKPVGADLRQGTVTLPLMLALEDSTVAPGLRALLAKPDLSDSDYEAVVDAVRSSHALRAAEAHARSFADRARAELSSLAPSEERAALERICDYVVERRL